MSVLQGAIALTFGRGTQSNFSMALSITQWSRSNNPHQNPVLYLDASAVIRHPGGQGDQNCNYTSTNFS